MSIPKPTCHVCPECGEECQVTAINDNFDYSGTHCTGGISGTHNVEIYYASDCCEVEIEDYEPTQEPDYDDRDASDYYCKDDWR